MLGPSEWLAGAGLLLTIMLTGGGVIWKVGEIQRTILTRMAGNKEELDNDLNLLRMAAYEEYKILRREMQEASSMAYREFGKTAEGLREKLADVELWTRDQIRDNRHEVDVKIEKSGERIRQLELFQAREKGFRPDSAS
jgi:hypothetical protein